MKELLHAKARKDPPEFNERNSQQNYKQQGKQPCESTFGTIYSSVWPLFSFSLFFLLTKKSIKAFYLLPSFFPHSADHSINQSGVSFFAWSDKLDPNRKVCHLIWTFGFLPLLSFLFLSWVTEIRERKTSRPCLPTAFFLLFCLLPFSLLFSLSSDCVVRFHPGLSVDAHKFEFVHVVSPRLCLEEGRTRKGRSVLVQLRPVGLHTAVDGPDCSCNEKEAAHGNSRPRRCEQLRCHLHQRSPQHCPGCNARHRRCHHPRQPRDDCLCDGGLVDSLGTDDDGQVGAFLPQSPGHLLQGGPWNCVRVVLDATQGAVLLDAFDKASNRSPNGVSTGSDDSALCVSRDGGVLPRQERLGRFRVQRVRL
mmetsp:Transcript_16280/g.33010  ORF Transcript_16280/g.33010 Transcript_16280/m.33010 type:complete len:364 (+) Transcript_16280:1117-2208(+)